MEVEPVMNNQNNDNNNDNNLENDNNLANDNNESETSNYTYDNYTYDADSGPTPESITLLENMSSIDISEDFKRVGHFTFSSSKYTGNKYVLYEYPLKLIYDPNFPIELRKKHVSLVYMFVVNGKIYKIGQSSCTHGINACMAFYKKAGQDDCGPNRFAINWLIRKELDNNSKVEVYMKYMEPIEVNVRGLISEKVMRVPISAKCMEKVCVADYKNIMGDEPPWNFQEHSESYPNEIKIAYAEYKVNRANN